MISRKATVSAAALLLASAGAAMAFPATSITSLNVRSGPGTNFGVVDTLRPGERVEVIDQNGGWYQLAAGGWASGNYLDAEGSAAVEVERYAVVDYPRYYGTPAFYFGADPFFWDDAGYYWYWREGRRHRVGWDWFRDHDHDDFRWSHARFRGDFERRWRDRDDDRFVRGDRDDDDDDRRIGRMGDDDSDAMGDGRRREWNERQGLRAEAEGDAEIRSGRASSNVEAGGDIETRGRRMEGGGRAGAEGQAQELIQPQRRGGGGGGGGY